MNNRHGILKVVLVQGFQIVQVVVRTVSVVGVLALRPVLEEILPLLSHNLVQYVLLLFSAYFFFCFVNFCEKGVGL